MSRDRHTIVVVCSADRHYLQPLAVTLVSALSHIEPGRDVHLHVIDGTIPDPEKGLFIRSVSDKAVSVFWHCADRSRFLGVPLWGRLPISVYDKLLVPDLLPRDVDQALWLDGDTLVLGDVAPLWDRGTDLHPLLAVQDPSVPLVSSRFGVSRYRELGLPDSAKYFNAGVMLMNLPLWRQQQINSRALAYLKRYARDVTFLEQEGLNAVLAGAWGDLDPMWNWSVSVGRVHAQTTTNTRPVILHFSGNLKPWKYDGDHSYYRTYYEYVDRTAWAGMRPPSGWRAAAFRAYEHSALRRLLHPTEHIGMRLWMRFSRRLATENDVSSRA